MNPAKWGLTLCLLLCTGLTLRGQVSPGALSRAHSSLDSPLKCASCHSFGEGAPKLRCEGCHREIRELVARKKGYHGRVVNSSKGDLDCARCHTEHYGQNFSIVRWPTSKDEFDHRTTGYALEGRHAALRCDQCHNARHIPDEQRKPIAVKDLSHTFMGLTTACVPCHEDRHAGQLSADCRKCHDFAKWKPAASFDHTAAKYPLTGKHQDVQCAKCHRPLEGNAKVIQYTKLQFAECSGCHQDPHRGAFVARCESCHNTGAWRAGDITSAFDHGKTKFPLGGKHAGLACQKCHKTTNFKTEIAHEKCMDCHQDQHKGQFASRADHGECGTCHTDKGWRPSTYTETSHKDTKFPLTAKHQGVACAKCHAPAGLDTKYHPAYQACLDCHRDPHGGQFSGAAFRNRCEDCHTAEGFHPSTFSISRHQSAPFALKGAHAAVACLDCHPTEGHPEGADRKFRFATLACAGCHQDPHRGEFPKAQVARLAKGTDVCESCHVLRSWKQLNAFDHSTTTFDLSGAHRVLACMDCHKPRPKDAAQRQIPFQTAPEKCASCHEDIHAGQFDRGGEAVDCGSCHGTTRWMASKFDHEKGSTFSLSGAHADVPCRLCHLTRKDVGGRKVIIYKGTRRECKSCHQ